MRHKPAVSSFNEKCEQAVIFARVSSPHQERGASIDAQLETIYNYCERKGFTIIKEFTITESSSRGDRKQYKEMLAFIKENRHKIAIVVNCVDRLQRSYKDSPALDELRRSGKIEVHFLKENLILHKDSNGSDILFWNLHVLMANSYILQLSDNVKRSLRYNRSIGKLQGKAPIGYINTKDSENKSTVIIDNERAPIIKKMFEMYATGRESLDSILQMTKEYGLKTKAYKTGIEKPITRNTVRDILTNPFYFGVIEIPDTEHPGYYVEVQHIYPPLIDKDLYDKVQDCLTGKAKIHSHPPKNGQIDFTFRGLIKCGTCGCVITTERHYKASNNKVYNILRCGHKKGNCTQRLVNENIILKQLDDEVFSKFRINVDLVPVLKNEVKKYLQEDTTLKNNAKKNAVTQLQNLKNQESRLLDLYIAGKINETLYQQKSSEFSKEKTELKKMADEVILADTQVKNVLEQAIDIAANISSIMKKANPKQKNEILHLLFTDCVLNGDRLQYKISSPFDLLLNNPKDYSWMNVKSENIKQYKELANNLSLIEI